MKLASDKGAVAFFLQDLDGGGAERAIVALAGDIAQLGHGVDLVVGCADGSYRSEVSSALRLHDFATRSPLRVFVGLVTYLRRHNPAVVMSALDVPNIMLVMAAKLSGYKGRTVISQRAVVSAGDNEATLIRRVVTRILRRLCFRRADAVVSNSYSAIPEIKVLLGARQDRIAVIQNAVDTDRIKELSEEPLPDRPVLDCRVPLIVSVGSLTKRKDMLTLIRAFSIVKAQRRAHLLIVGEGSERAALETAISGLGLSAEVHLVGFDPNPYKWMAAASVFVSSSTAEGFPNVVAEALALGNAIVATDCPGDTGNLLGGGKWGRLVPVGDSERMASAILAALDDKRVAEGGARAAEFSQAKTTETYLKVLFPGARS